MKFRILPMRFAAVLLTTALLVISARAQAVSFEKKQEDERGAVHTQIATEQMASSLDRALATQRAELADLQVAMQQLENLQAAVQTEINFYDIHAMDLNRLLLEAHLPIEALEGEHIKNRRASRKLATSVQTFQTRYDSASFQIQQTDALIELANKQMASIRSARFPEIQKQKMVSTARNLFRALKEKKQLGARYLKIYGDLLDQMKTALEAKKVLAEKLGTRLREQKKESLFTRSETYRGYSVETLQETLQLCLNRIKAVSIPELWKAQWTQIKMGGITRWAVFLFALIFVIALQGHGRRFLRRVEEKYNGAGWYYRRMGLRLLRHSLLYLGMTPLFGIYSSYHLSLLDIGLARFLLKLFVILMLTRWAVDYLDDGLRRPQTPLRSFVILHLKRFFPLFRAAAIFLVFLIWVSGSSNQLALMARNLLSVAVLFWAIVFWRQIKPVVAKRVPHGQAPPDPKWTGLCQWGTYLIFGGTPLIGLVGYNNLARHWGQAWIETAAILFWGWISLNVIREWHGDHRARVKAADDEHPLGSVDECRWAMIHLARLVWIVGLPVGLVWAWDSSGFLFSQLGCFVDATVTIGSLRVSIKGILLVTVIVFLTHLVVHVGRAFLKEKFLDKKSLERGLKDSILTITSYLVWGLGLVFVLGALGVNATSLAVIFGALSIGIGFGLQNIFNNFISGLILLFERPIQVGDYVEVNGLWAEVKKINVRATVVQTFDNASVIIPNSEFISQQVTNWSFKDKRMRRNIEVGVAYGSDIDLVEKTLLEIAHNTRNVLKYPQPQLLFTDHGASALIFSLRLWVHVDDHWTVPSQIRKEIDRRFRELAIEIAFPQQDVHIRTIPREFTSDAPIVDSDEDPPNNQEPVSKKPYDQGVKT